MTSLERAVRSLSDSQLVLLCAVSARLLTVSSLLLLPQFTPAWDDAASAVLDPEYLWLQGFLRWDTLYFEKIARNGYQLENEFAFMPGLPWLMSHFRSFSMHSGMQTVWMLVGGVVFANVAAVLATCQFYRCAVS